MIYRATRTQADIESLAHRYDHNHVRTACNYKHRVINKPWGYEYLMFETAGASVWMLSINSMHSTSLHCHRHKKTSLTVLSGSAEFTGLNSQLRLSPLDCVSIETGVFHSIRALAETGAFVQEIESPPDKNDLIRLKDPYGREETGYEGLDTASSDLRNYEYYYFDEPCSCTVTISGQRLISIEEHTRLPQLYDRLNGYEGTVVGFLGGSVLDQQRTEVFTAGDIAGVREVKVALANDAVINGGVTVLTVR